MTAKIGCGKIYKMYVNNSDIVYIGSTFEKYVSDRLKQHRRDYKQYKNGKNNYLTSFQLFDLNEDVQILELERYNDITKAEIKKYELEAIKSHSTAVNKNKPQNIEYNGDLKQWNKEYYKSNKDKFKEYLELNKYKITEYQKKYLELNKDKITEYQKEYRDLNKEEYIEYQKEYRESNKNKINERAREKFLCEICGGKYTYINKAQHEKTQKHQKAINN